MSTPLVNPYESRTGSDAPGVRELLTTVQSVDGLDVSMVIGEDGDVHVHPEAGFFQKIEDDKPQDDDFDVVDPEVERESRLWGNLSRIVGLLADNGLPSQPQQHRALSDTIFAGTDPFAPDDVIATKAKAVRAALANEDEPGDTRFSH